MRNIFDIDPKKRHIFNGLWALKPTFVNRIVFMDWRGQVLLGFVSVLTLLGEIL